MNEPNKSCSDAEFGRLIKKEHPKIKKLIGDAICDHYLLFTNRKLTGGSDQKLIDALLKLGLKIAHIIGNERLHMALDQFPHIRDSLPNAADPIPFQFIPDDLLDVIDGLHAFAGSGKSAFNSARDFGAIRIKDEKNKINGLGRDYYEQIIVSDSMPHFARVEEFLKNPRIRRFFAHSSI